MNPSLENTPHPYLDKNREGPTCIGAAPVQLWHSRLGGTRPPKQDQEQASWLSSSWCVPETSREHGSSWWPQHFLQEWRQQKHVVCDLGSLVCLMHPVSKGLDSVLRSNVLRVFSYWKGKFMHILGKYVLIWFACCPSFRAYFYQVSEKQDARFQRVLQLHQTWSRYQREGNSVSSAAFPVHSSGCPLQQVNKKPVGSDLLIRQ